MKIKSIKNDNGYLYLQLVRNKNYIKLLTKLCLKLGIRGYYKIENELRIVGKGEHYSMVKEGEKIIQVILTESYIFLIINSPDLERKYTAIIGLIDSI